MKQMLLKAMSVLVGLAMSVAFVGCGDDDNKDEPKPGGETQDVVETVAVDYSVSLGKAYWDYFDISVEYTTPAGEVVVKTITQAWEEKYEVRLAQVVEKYVMKVTATPKADHPEVTDGMYYDMATNIHAEVSGKTKSGKYDPEFGYEGSNTGNWEATSKEMNRRLQQTNLLLDFSYNVVK